MDFGPIFIPYFTLGFLFNKHTQYLYITKLIIGNAFSFRPKRRYASSFCSLPHIFAKYFPNIYWKRKIKIKIKKIKERNKEEVGSTRHTGNVVGHPLGVTFWHIILLVTLSVARSPSPIQNKQQKKKTVLFLIYPSLYPPTPLIWICLCLLSRHINTKIMLKVLCYVAPLLITSFLSGCVVLVGSRSSIICYLDCY